jgi:hypothetical protein
MAIDPEVRVRLPLLPDFLGICGSELAPLKLASTTEELLVRESSSFGLESKVYAKFGTDFAD